MSLKRFQCFYRNTFQHHWVQPWMHVLLTKYMSSQKGWGSKLSKRFTIFFLVCTCTVPTYTHSFKFHTHHTQSHTHLKGGFSCVCLSSNWGSLVNLLVNNYHEAEKRARRNCFSPNKVSQNKAQQLYSIIRPVSLWIDFLTLLFFALKNTLCSKACSSLWLQSSS